MDMSSLLVTVMAPPPPSLVSTTTTTGSFSSPSSLWFSPTATVGGSTPTPTLASSRLPLCSAASWSKQGVFVSHAKSVPAGVFWEEPDVGYDSEWGEGDEEDNGVEEDKEGEGEGVANMGGRRGSSTEVSHDQEIPAGILLLLSAEEKAILQQNEVSDLNKISTKKWNLFHTLALSGQIPIMDNLLKDGVHVDAVDKDGYTALHRAVIGKKEAVISHLLRKGANPHCEDRDGATPLHYAVQVGAMQTVKLLIKYKVDVNVADNDGWTPLHIAIQSRSRDIAKVLLINDADKTRRNKDGKTPLDISLCYGRDFMSYELAKLLKLVPAGRDL